MPPFTSRGQKNIIYSIQEPVTEFRSCQQFSNLVTETCHSVYEWIGAVFRGVGSQFFQDDPSLSFPHRLRQSPSFGLSSLWECALKHECTGATHTAICF